MGILGDIQAVGSTFYAEYSKTPTKLKVRVLTLAPAKARRPRKWQL